MSQFHPSVRHGDPAIKWLVGGGILLFAGGIFFLAFLADELKTVGPTGAGAILGIGIAACAAVAAIGFGPVGRAIGKRILGNGGDRSADELHDLRLQVDDLRNALAESQERIDFAERLLAGGPDRASEELH